MAAKAAMIHVDSVMASSGQCRGRPQCCCAGGTRTCIHTPGPPLHPDEITDDAVDSALSGAALVFFDGRLTEAALKLAEAANWRR